MSDENVGGLPELPEPAMHERNPYLGLAVDPYEGLRALKWYSAEQMHAYARAALSAHGALLFTQADMERFAGYVADAREERLKSAHGQPEPNGKLVGWWNGIRPDVLDRTGIGPSIRWGAEAENTHHDIPLYDGYNPIHYVTPPAHGQPVVDAELMKRVLGAPYDGVTVGDFFVYADFSEHDTLGVVRAIVAAALRDTP